MVAGGLQQDSLLPGPHALQLDDKAGGELVLGIPSWIL